MDREPYVAAERQLVVEVHVSDIERSLAFYERLGFERGRTEARFTVLTWEYCELFLAELAGGNGRETPQANVRIMVPDVDRYWILAQELGLIVAQPIGDRYYGLRDFTVLDPDGFGLRFASLLLGPD
jgi:catechol 2,3-dioxygenase-like lactoylglutathione lyase family enzyme